MLPPTERGKPRGASCTSVDRRSVFPPRLVGLYLYSIDHRAASSNRKIVARLRALFRGNVDGPAKRCWIRKKCMYVAIVNGKSGIIFRHFVIQVVTWRGVLWQSFPQGKNSYLADGRLVSIVAGMPVANQLRYNARFLRRA